jgi:coenzyme F420-0:L-glutamate ligase/coenzyme F420-1:gamma-L-glutamate ligase
MMIVYLKRVDSMVDKIQIIPIKGLPLIKKGDELAKLICNAAERQGTPVQNGDVIVITHVMISKAEGSVVNLDEVKPSEFAKTIAKQMGKDPAIVEVVLRESKSIIRMGNNSIITETKHGFFCANSGVDRSNVSGERNVALLPKNPDKSAARVRRKVKALTGNDVAVIVSDTHGRPLRDGEINVAIGVAGFKPIRDRRGEKDLYGYTLRIKRTAIADELASAAELVIGQANEGIPVAIVRGYSYPKSEDGMATELIRPREKEFFI